ncbi:MAG: hypothetical protein AB9866_27745 [Syntrophobacteraceae bacterium]
MSAAQVETPEKENKNGARGFRQETEKPAPNNLAVKIAKIRREINRMPRSGRNGDLQDTIRALLTNYGVLLSKSVSKFDQLEDSVIVWMSFRLECTGSGEILERKFPAVVQGNSDQNIDEAAAAAEKFWMFETFLVSTGGELEPKYSFGSGGR